MRSQTILIVDDEPANLTVLNQLLSPMYRVIACKSGEQALNNAEKEPPPDLILLDVMMPGMDGYEVMQNLRKNKKTQDIPVVFITAMGGEVDEERGIKLGAIDYITKPIKPAIVKARVCVHLELKLSRDLLKEQNVWLEAEVVRRMRDNILVQDVSLAALAQLAETRDTDTGNHILRTQAYVEAIARKLQTHPRFAAELNEVHLLRIVKAAPLHDIGKVGIPDHILLKPGKLTPEEWKIMQSHSRLGGQTIGNAIKRAITISGKEPLVLQDGKLTEEKHNIMKDHSRIGGDIFVKVNDYETDAVTAGAAKLAALEFLEVAQVIATSHHEKWDGSGYPDGLAGEAIPLPGRLMALADVFDALTTPRVYKKAWSMEQAIDFILEQKGKHFDPDIVEAFDSLRATFIDIQRHLADVEPDAGSKEPS